MRLRKLGLFQQRGTMFGPGAGGGGGSAVPSAVTSTITVVPNPIPADGTAGVATVQAKDAAGNNITVGGALVEMTWQNGSPILLTVTDHNDGTYTAPVPGVHSPFDVTKHVFGVLNGVNMTNDAAITYTGV